MRGELKMDWKEKMIFAMKLLKEACKANGSCLECPFRKKCDLITENTIEHYPYDTPETWKIE